MPKKRMNARQYVQVGEQLNEVITIRDAKGKVIDRVVRPLMLHFYAHDALQVVVGAAILAIPVAYTEETWNLGTHLALTNVLCLTFLSLAFIALFTYYTYYSNHFRTHWQPWLKRVFFTYSIAFATVALLLTLINQAPWQIDFAVALKRTIIAAFPASLSAAVVDVLK